jgi:hypothetical protein
MRTEEKENPKEEEKHRVSAAKWAAVGVIATALLGAVSAIVVAYFHIVEVRTAAQIQAAQTAEARSLPVSCAEYGIQITSPRETDNVPEEFQIAGTYTKQPPEGRVILYFLSTDLKWYWPEGEVKFDPVDKRWTGDFNIRGTPPMEAWAEVVLVGEAGRMIYDYYWNNGLKHDVWEPFEKLTPDVEVCDRVYLKRTE